LAYPEILPRISVGFWVLTEAEGASVGTLSVRILIVDDYEPWRRFVLTELRSQPEVQIVGEVSDGLEAVEVTQKLQPDLILLDIGLPTLNGIEAARRILELSPKSTILFVSENRSWDIAEEALRTGAIGYVLKSDAARELLPAIKAALEDRQFVSAGLTGRNPADSWNENTCEQPHFRKVEASHPVGSTGRLHTHGVLFYADDRMLLDEVTQFTGTALKRGSAAIVAATEPHRASLVPRLQNYGIALDKAIDQGAYIAVDAADTLSTFMVNGMLDPIRFIEAFGNLIATVSKAAKRDHPRVAVFGECVNILWAQGNGEAAIQMEKLGNQLIDSFDVDILCGYSLDRVAESPDARVFQQIREQHSAVHFG
jgi:DNA-binding NarL/FixJ family response regulator